MNQGTNKNVLLVTRKNSNHKKARGRAVRSIGFMRMVRQGIRLLKQLPYKG